MNFLGVIQNHYTLEQAKIIIHLLQSQGLFCAMQKHSEVFYQAKAVPGSPAMLQQFKLYAQAMIRLLSDWLLRGKPDCHKQQTTDALLQLFTFLAIEAKVHSKLKRYEFFAVFQELFHTEPGLLLWKPYTDHILIDYIELKSQLEEARNSSVGPNHQNLCEVYFCWCHFAGDKENYISLDAFIHDLAKLFKGLQYKKTLYLLFSDQPQDFKIVVPKKYLLEFMAVFYELHRCGRIICKNNKGIFKHLQAHIKAAPGEELPAWKDYAQWYCMEMKSEHNRRKVFSLIQKLLNTYGCH
jgi:hypothetical protein